MSLHNRITVSLEAHYPVGDTGNECSCGEWNPATTEWHTHQATVAMAVVEPALLAAQVDATERADTLAARLEEAEADAKSARQNAQDWHEVAEAREKRAEQAEDQLRNAEQAYTALRERAEAAEAARARWQKRGEQAEATVERVRALAQAAKDPQDRSLSRQFGGAPWPASVPADDVLAALDEPGEVTVAIRVDDSEFRAAVDQGAAVLERVREAETIHRVAHPSPVGGCPACHILSALDARPVARGAQTTEETP
ncbi:hypothetical protein GCM10023085_45710 [Actinomadura viridis]|uniref:Uncharacterized protein n=1 Tax=Actinomadura viridis TaxID=58110 RepID=A0A931DIE7_9ACTN|nr:hypothetical protein [Actinomadura viridis]MBG6089932.1 hypothetical protein [Actinomadura viridis]